MDKAATREEDDEWEVINDDGFVYKRKRRSHLLPPSSSSSTAPAQLPDPTLEVRFRREQKKLRLVKLKERYQREINQWEHLSNTLSSSIQQQQKKAQETDGASTWAKEFNASSIVPSSDSSTCGRNLVDELISQAEAEEGIIENVEYLCDIAEGICSAKEESNKQSFIQLPLWTWSTPHELIKSLSAVDD